MEIVEYRGVEGLVAAEVLTDDNGTDGYTTGTVFEIAGVAEISKSTDVQQEPHFYDNIPAVIVGNEASDTVTISTSAIPLDVQAKLTGQTYDTTLGALVEGKRRTVYHALGYKTKDTSGNVCYVWRYKGMFALGDQVNSTENDSTDANGQELTYTGIFTTHKFTKTGQEEKALVVNTGLDLANVSTFFDTVTTHDTLTVKTP